MGQLKESGRVEQSFVAGIFKKEWLIRVFLYSWASTVFLVVVAAA